MDNQELIDGLIEQSKDLPWRDDSKLDALWRRTEMMIRNVFGPTSTYLKDLNDINFYHLVYPKTSTPELEAWRDAQVQLLNLLKTMAEELRLFQLTVRSSSRPQEQGTGRKVFIVHGHDEEMKQFVSRVLSGLDFDPVILHEKPNQGRTIIEKFTDYSGSLSR